MQKVVTIKTIAKEVGLSLSAVSKALNDYQDINEETKKRVVRKALELGYTPNLIARSLVTKSSNSLGVIVRDSQSIYGELLKRLSDKLIKENVTLLMADSNRNAENEEWYVQQMLGSRVKVLVIAPVSNDISSIKNIVRNSIPVIYVGGMIRDPDENYVCNNVEMQAEISMDYLLKLGHTKIAFLGRTSKSVSYGIRESVYKREMEKHSLQIYDFTSPEEDTHVDAGYKMMNSLLDQDAGITAVYCATDMIAIGAIKAADERGVRIPEDISIIGNDGQNAAALPTINLTTVALPREEFLDNIIRIAKNQADNPLERRREHYLARPVLIERTSCRRL